MILEGWRCNVVGEKRNNTGGKERWGGGGGGGGVITKEIGVSKEKRNKGGRGIAKVRAWNSRRYNIEGLVLIGRLKRYVVKKKGVGKRGGRGRGGGEEGVMWTLVSCIS